MSAPWLNPSQRVRRSLVRQAVALSTISAALAPAAAHADAESFGGGLYVGYTFGERRGFEWGVEAFATHRFKGTGSCSAETRTGLGPLLQLGLIELRDPRVTLALQGGGEFGRGAGIALTGELGLTYRGGDKAGFGLHTGLVPELSILNAAFRYEWFLDDAWLGVGARYWPTYGEPGACSVGRPLRTDMGLARMREAVRVEGDRTGMEHARIQTVGLAWARDAQLECASVPAFLQLARDLAVNGAPFALVGRALDAARDEIVHAELCATLASRHLGERVIPSAPEVGPRGAAVGRDGLIRLAVESWLDGCVSEGIAARQAACAASGCIEPDTRTVQQRISVDEQRHAALGWSVLQWALASGGDDVREAVLAVRGLAPLEVASDSVEDGLETHGRLGAEAINTIAQQHINDSRARLDRIMHAYA